MKEKIKNYMSTLQRFDPRIALAIRDFSSLKAEKTIVLALLVQLIIAGFSSFLVVGIVAIYDSESGGSEVHLIGVETDNEKLQDILYENDKINVGMYDSTSDGITAVENGEINAFIEVDTSKSEDTYIIHAPESNLQTPIVINEIQDVMKQIERDERQENVDQIETTIVDYPMPNEKSSNPYYTFTYTVLLPLLVFLPVFISGSVAVDTLTEEIEQGTLDILLTTPITLSDIITSKVAVATLLGPLQASIWIILLFLNGIHVSHPFSLLLFVTGLTMVFVTMGIIVAVISPNRQYAQMQFSLILISVFSLLTVLPEHPANTAAKLSAGSATLTTFGFSVLYVVFGLVTLTLITKFANTQLQKEVEK